MKCYVCAIDRYGWHYLILGDTSSIIKLIAISKETRHIPSSICERLQSKQGFF